MYYKLFFSCFGASASFGFNFETGLGMNTNKNFSNKPVKKQLEHMKKQLEHMKKQYGIPKIEL